MAGVEICCPLIIKKKRLIPRRLKASPPSPGHTPLPAPWAGGALVRRRRRLLEVDVAAGEVGRLLRLPRRHPQLSHPTTGLLRLRSSHLRWTRLGLHSTSLRPTSLWQTRLRPTSLGPTTSLGPPSLGLPSLRPTRLRSSVGVTLSRSRAHGRTGRSRVHMVVFRVETIVLIAIARVSGLRGAKSTSVVVQSSRPPRRPPTRGG